MKKRRGGKERKKKREKGGGGGNEEKERKWGIEKRKKNGGKAGSKKLNSVAVKFLCLSSLFLCHHLYLFHTLPPSKNKKQNKNNPD